MKYKDAKTVADLDTYVNEEDIGSYVDDSEEEFQMLLDSGVTPEQIPDEESRAKYEEYIKKVSNV